MFEWLERELSIIKTPRFHMVDGPVEPELREAVMQTSLQLPVAYREFVLKFGNAKLYRRPQNDSYRIGIFAGPREGTFGDGTRVYQIGFHDGAKVYIEATARSSVSPIWEVEQGLKERMGEDFEDWLARCCVRAREEYGPHEWAGIVRGPEPFSPEEKEIIEARRQIRWRVVGIDTEQNHVFEITNASDRRLLFLTVGVRSRDRRLNGAVLLRIEHIAPGQTATLHAGCYKEFMSPKEIEIFELPDPQPENRAFYGEFAYT